MQRPDNNTRVSTGAIPIRAGMTLLEMVIAMAIVVVIMTAILPAFRSIRNSWDSKQAAAETLQNGRVLIDHLNYNLSKAVKITEVNDSSIGYIQFEDNDGNNWRYEVGDSNLVKFGLVGSLSDLAGPVSRLQFTCYDGNDFVNPTTDVNSIRFVDVNTTLTNSATLGRDKTFTASIYLRTNANADLVGWWKLDETSGLTAADSSGSGNNGALVGDPNWMPTGGQIGGALDFDGTNDYVTIPDGAYLHIENLSISFWVKTSQTGSSGEWYKNPLILEKDTPGLGNDGFGTGLNNQKLEFVIGDSVLTSNRSVSDGVWHHIVLTKDSSKNTAIYIDGSFDESGVAIYNFTNTAALHIGKPLQGAYFNGVIDDVRIYDRVLTAEEIAQLANVLTYRDCTEAQ